MPEYQFAGAEKVVEELLVELGTPCDNSKVPYNPDDLKEGKTRYFRHPALICLILNIQYKSKNGLGCLFASNIGPLAAHITLALAGTALYASLKELSTEVFEAANFSINLYRKFYKKLMSLINNVIMHDNELREDFEDLLAFIVSCGMSM
ncbi:hypothetical protein SERLADRAFT_434164 [Serpula lacrymans var. lacrymans S7.9]|uniref:DUF6532 domain-containing protein n=1 Tax=Serpula lacrymans var. lacrymans (strain S7.9) TaxID=578457 RepID=F8NJQ1_SERL9|nr:uncharacterized protein SERLADRAFT_434164 [Serpula lacrymans var. lacrymans S7.9]EGO28266.1 hypothetical protein SERLADRAFT_434164 [Serpula lacrymans var. lacrymans S7.9]